MYYIVCNECNAMQSVFFFYLIADQFNESKKCLDAECNRQSNY